MVLDKPADSMNVDETFAPGMSGGQIPPLDGDTSLLPGLKPRQNLKPSIEILSNNQVSSAELIVIMKLIYNFKEKFTCSILSVLFVCWEENVPFIDKKWKKYIQNCYTTEPFSKTCILNWSKLKQAL